MSLVVQPNQDLFANDGYRDDLRVIPPGGTNLYNNVKWNWREVITPPVKGLELSQTSKFDNGKFNGPTLASRIVQLKPQTLGQPTLTFAQTPNVPIVTTDVDNYPLRLNPALLPANVPHTEPDSIRSTPVETPLETPRSSVTSWHSFDVENETPNSSRGSISTPWNGSARNSVASGLYPGSSDSGRSVSHYPAVLASEGLIDWPSYTNIAATPRESEIVSPRDSVSTAEAVTPPELIDSTGTSGEEVEDLGTSGGGGPGPGPSGGGGGGPRGPSPPPRPARRFGNRFRPLRGSGRPSGLGDRLIGGAGPLSTGSSAGLGVVPTNTSLGLGATMGVTNRRGFYGVEPEDVVALPPVRNVSVLNADIRRDSGVGDVDTVAVLPPPDVDYISPENLTAGVPVTRENFPTPSTDEFNQMLERTRVAHERAGDNFTRPNARTVQRGLNHLSNVQTLLGLMNETDTAEARANITEWRNRLESFQRTFDPSPEFISLANRLIFIADSLHDQFRDFRAAPQQNTNLRSPARASLSSSLPSSSTSEPSMGSVASLVNNTVQSMPRAITAESSSRKRKGYTEDGVAKKPRVASKGKTGKKSSTRKPRKAAPAPSITITTMDDIQRRQSQPEAPQPSSSRPQRAAAVAAAAVDTRDQQDSAQSSGSDFEIKKKPPRKKQGKVGKKVKGKSKKT